MLPSVPDDAEVLRLSRRRLTALTRKMNSLWVVAAPLSTAKEQICG